MKYSLLSVLLLISLVLGTVKSVKLVMAGGGDIENASDIFSTFIQLATPQSGQPYIGICTAASETAEENGQYYIDIFKNQYNVSNVVWIPITLATKQLANSQSMVVLMTNMTGIFFGGGDQLRLKQIFTNSATYQLMIQNLLSGQLAVGGTSAGCAILQGTPMVTGGESYNALMYGAYDTIDTKYPDDLSYEKTGGFGFFNQTYLDTHFGTRGREGRLIQLIGQLYNENISQIQLGFGVDEATAVKVDGNNLEILGLNGAYLIDMTKAKYTKSYRQWSNVIVNYLTQGDKVTISGNSYQITFASNKKNINGQQKYDYPASISYDIFSSPDDYDESGRKYPNEFTYISTDLWNTYNYISTYAYTYEDNPPFKVVFDKAQGQAYYIESQDSRQISYQGMVVSVAEDQSSFLERLIKQYTDKLRNSRK